MAQLLQETSNLNAIRNMTKPSSIQDSFSERGTINSLVYLPSGDDKNSTLGAAKKFIIFGNWNLKQGMQSKSLTKKIEQILEQDVLRLIVKACGNLEPYTLPCTSSRLSSSFPQVQDPCRCCTVLYVRRLFCGKKRVLQLTKFDHKYNNSISIQLISYTSLSTQFWYDRRMHLHHCSFHSDYKISYSWLISV